MRARRGILTVLALLFATAHLGATVRYVKWDKPHIGHSGNVSAIDLSTGKVIWEAKPGKSVNFVVATSVGVLVGNDEGSLVLLNSADGSTVWTTSLTKKEISKWHGESDEGFFVSSGDEHFWLVDKSGRILLECWQGCTPTGNMNAPASTRGVVSVVTERRDVAVCTRVGSYDNEARNSREFIALGHQQANSRGGNTLLVDVLNARTVEIFTCPSTPPHAASLDDLP